MPDCWFVLPSIFLGAVSLTNRDPECSDRMELTTKSSAGANGLFLVCSQVFRIAPKLGCTRLSCPAKALAQVTCNSSRLPRNTRRSLRILRLNYIDHGGSNPVVDQRNEMRFSPLWCNGPRLLAGTPLACVSRWVMCPWQAAGNPNNKISFRVLRALHGNVPLSI